MLKEFALEVSEFADAYYYYRSARQNNKDIAIQLQYAKDLLVAQEKYGIEMYSRGHLLEMITYLTEKKLEGI